MKIGINTTPLVSKHQLRGIGTYTKMILQALKLVGVEVMEFTDINKLKDVDLVHYPWFDLYFHTLPVYKKFKSVVTIHDVIPLLFPENYPVGLRGRINFLLQRLSLVGVSKIITDSQCSKEDIMKYLHPDESKIDIVYLAADPIFRSLDQLNQAEIIKRYNLAKRFVLYVGDANWNKNLTTLARAFDKLSKEPDFADLKLVMVGEAFLKNRDDLTHPDLLSLRDFFELISKYGLGEKVLYTGKVSNEEMVKLFNLAACLVQPSYYEGFGLPVLEAMSSNLPVIAAKASSLVEIADDGALFFDPHDPDELFSSIKRLLTDQQLQDSLVARAQKRAAEFSLEKTGNALKKVYEEVL